ncbi:fibronectin type III domain protein, partial [Oesophagostomum dentatum]
MQNCTFACKFTQPAVSVRWFRSERELWTQHPKIEIVTEGNESLLIISNVVGKDVGEYYALVDDVEKSRSAMLSYKVVPKLTYEGPTEAIAAGKPFDFIIRFAGYPAPEFTMTLDDKDLKLQADVETYDDFISFRVKHVKESGTIKISAKNEHGEDTVEIPMQVIDVPSAPLDLQASDIGPTGATLSWKAPLFSNGSEIKEYCIERKSVEYSRWRTVGRIPSNNLFFTVDDLFSNDLYAFRVSAVNEIGRGPPSKIAEVETAQEVEEEFELDFTLTKKEPAEGERLEEELIEQTVAVPAAVSDELITDKGPEKEAAEEKLIDSQEIAKEEPLLKAEEALTIGKKMEANKEPEIVVEEAVAPPKSEEAKAEPKEKVMKKKKALKKAPSPREEEKDNREEKNKEEVQENAEVVID